MANDITDLLYEFNTRADITIESLADLISDIAEPVRHGRWKYTKRDRKMCYGVCSVCKKGTTFFFKNGTDYCPFCGAKMDEGEKND